MDIPDQQLCRFCFLRHGEMQLFDDNALNSEAVEIVSQHFQIEMSKDDLFPNTICTECWGKIECFHQFHTSVLANQKAFLGKFRKNYIKREDECHTADGDNKPIVYDEIDFVSVNEEPPVSLGDVKTESSKVGDVFEANAASSEMHLRSARGRGKKFTCDICGAKFIYLKYLRSHILEIHVNNRIMIAKICDICNKRFSNKSTLKAHIALKHGGLPHTERKVAFKNISASDRAKFILENFDMKCTKCTTVFNSWENAKKHYTSVHRFRYGFIMCCKKKLRKETEINEHIDYHFNPNLYRCEICGKTVKSKKLLLTHRRKHDVLDLNSLEQNGPEDLKIPDYFERDCDLCESMSFTTFEQAQAHYSEVHENQKAYVRCCGLKLSFRKEVQSHIEWHKDPDIFTCKVCQKTHVSEKRLKSHMDIHTKEHVCKTCCKHFRNIENLWSHDCRLKRTKVNCDQCNKSFNSLSYLRGHVRRMHESSGTYICEICANVCKNKESLYSHMRRHTGHLNSDSDKVQCEACGAWLGNKYRLKQHMERHNAQPIKCDKCDKIAPNRGALTSHMRAVHSDANFKCHLCPKAFTRSSALKDHIATHSNDRQYKCTYCEETFIWRMNMYKHQKKMHPKEWSEDQAKKAANKRPTS